MTQFSLVTDFPTSFLCTSGELVFGQVQCVLEGMKNQGHDGIRGQVARTGGTILQHDFQYRVAARVGRWQVSRVYVRGTANEGRNWLVGYVLHHEDVSPLDFVRRAAKVGISNGNKHADKEIVYVNRYDWGWHHGSREPINVALGAGRPHTVEQVSSLMGGRLIVFDASNNTSFISALRNQYLERQCFSLLSSPTAAPYGIHLDAADNNPEYELGWLGFSGKKHDKFPESDELVAIVYDPAYYGFDPSYSGPENTPSTQVITVEDAEVITVANLLSSLEDDNEDEEYVPDEDEEDGDDEEENDSSESVSSEELASLRLPDEVPPPSISDITYNKGGSITITGSMLGSVTLVTLQNIEASFDIKSNQVIQARIPPGVSGEGNVRLRGCGGESEDFSFTFPSIAMVTSISPKEGTIWGGTKVTIEGFHLDKTTSILFGDIPALSFSIISPSRIKAIAPAGMVAYKWHNTLALSLESGYEVVPGPHHLHYWPDYTLSPLDTNYEAALRTWKLQVERCPDSWDALSCLQAVYDKLGNDDANIALWKDLVERRPEAPRAHVQLAKAYVKVAKWPDTIHEWNAALENGADDKEIFLGLAVAYRKIGDEAASIRMRNEMERLWANSGNH